MKRQTRLYQLIEEILEATRDHDLERVREINSREVSDLLNQLKQNDPSSKEFKLAYKYDLCINKCAYALGDDIFGSYEENLRAAEEIFAKIPQPNDE